MRILDLEYSNLRSVEAEEGRGAGVVVVGGVAGVEKKNCLMISASSSCSSCFLVAIVLSAADARAVFVVRSAALVSVLICSRRGRRRSSPSGRAPSPCPSYPRRRYDFGFHLLGIFVDTNRLTQFRSEERQPICVLVG